MDGLQPGFQFTQMLAQLGDLTFGVVDSDGVHWHYDIDGWDGTEVKTTVTPRESDHGSWQSPVYLAERVITLAGKAVAPDLETLDRAAERLLAAAALTDTTLTVWETIPKQATVRRSGKPLAKRLTDRVLDWSLLLTAVDPRRYGTTLHTAGPVHLPSVTGGMHFPLTMPITFGATVNGGQATARNIGTFPSRPILTITGPVVQPQIIATWPDGTLHTLTYTSTLAAGDVLTLDVDAHDAYLPGGVSRSRYVTGEWPELPPGDTTLAFRSPGYSSTATLAASWRPAWT